MVGVSKVIEMERPLRSVRAYEIVEGSRWSVTSKIDVWALGCNCVFAWRRKLPFLAMEPSVMREATQRILRDCTLTLTLMDEGYQSTEHLFFRIRFISLQLRALTERLDPGLSRIRLILACIILLSLLFVSRLRPC